MHCNMNVKDDKHTLLSRSETEKWRGRSESKKWWNTNQKAECKNVLWCNNETLVLFR